MTDLAGVGVALFVALAAIATPVRGQTGVLLGLGSTFPVGTVTASGPFAQANTGWQATLGIDRAIGSSGLAVGARAFYGANGYEGPGEQDSSLLGVTAVGIWALAEGIVSPHLWSEAGFLSHKYSADSGGLLGGAEESSEEAFLVAGGLGAGIPIGSAELLFLGGYSRALGVFDDLSYFVLTAVTRLAIG